MPPAGGVASQTPAVLVRTRGRIPRAGGNTGSPGSGGPTDTVSSSDPISNLTSLCTLCPLMSSEPRSVLNPMSSVSSE